MKRVVLVLFLALIAIFSVCAIVVDTQSATVSLTLENSMFAAERFGFIRQDADMAWKESDDMSVLPASQVTDFSLTYVPTDNVGRNNDIAIFYKVKGAEPVNMTFTITDHLKCKGKNPIEFKVTVGSGNEKVELNSGVTHNVWASTIELSTDKIFEAKVIPLSIETTTVLDASMVSADAYTSSITLLVQGA